MKNSDKNRMLQILLEVKPDIEEVNEETRVVRREQKEVELETKQRGWTMSN